VKLGFCTVEVEVALTPKFHAQLVGAFVEVSVKFTVSGAVPDVGVAPKLATGADVGVVARRAMSACQYRRVELLLARTTSPVRLLTLCFVDVTLFMLALTLSRMTAVPRPDGKVIVAAFNDAVFS
jgi:hypothetical protein